MISFVLFPQASQPCMNFNISELVYFLSKVIFLFLLFLGMLMAANKVETK